MPTADFDLPSLAEYLHLSVPQVQKLVERGELPGRRVAGQWRFAPAEVHHWLEDRIGVADVSELSQMSSALEAVANRAGDESITLAALLPLEAVAVPLAARTRDSVIREMAELAARTGLMWDAPRLAEAVRERENLHPTALESGVALLHPRRPLASILAQPLVALGCTAQGLPFGGGGSGLTDVFFLICSTSDRGHLRTLARISRLIAQPGLLSALRAATTSREAYDVLLEQESELD